MNSRVEWALWWCNMMIAMKNLTVVSVLAEPEKRIGEARESTKEENPANSYKRDSRGGSHECPNCGRLLEDCCGNCIFNE